MKTLTFIFIILLFTGCVTGKYAQKDQDKHTIRYRAVGGVSHGGIVENTTAGEVDGFTGATKLGFNAGGHVVLPVGKSDIETGLEYQYSEQGFTYNNDLMHGYRNIQLSQLVVPLTFNINPLARWMAPEVFSIKLGAAFQYNLPAVSDDGDLPGYSINRISKGAHIEFSTLPFQFKNGARAGLSISGYRGSQIFEDSYNSSESEEPGSSYFKASIIYQF